MSKIEWTEKTWNPIHGCTKVSEACENCYAEVMAKRLQGNHIKSYENGFAVTRNIDAMKEPYKWQKPTMVFVVSMGDLFHNAVPDEWINPIMRVIEKTPQHTYQLLTKRPWNMEEYFLRHPVPKNVWLGTMCENRRHYDRIDALRDIKCNNVKFISCNNKWRKRAMVTIEKRIYNPQTGRKAQAEAGEAKDLEILASDKRTEWNIHLL